MKRTDYLPPMYRTSSTIKSASAASLLMLLAFFAASAQAAVTVETLTLQRADQHAMPARVHSSASNRCERLALLSPGAGGDAEELAYLADGLARSGWLALVMGHEESGPAALKQRVKQAGLKAGLLALTTDADAYRYRFMDIDTALAWATQHCGQAPRDIVLIGHSMGAATTMMEAGASNAMGISGKNRMQAYVALSPQGPGSLFPKNAWAQINAPVLSLTGTRDDALEGGWQSRTLPYANMPSGCKWLGVIDGATHMHFAGRGFSGKAERLTLSSVLAFLQARQADGRCSNMPPAQGMQSQFK
ncbi:alpha/beta hydrolase family protein [Methylobacillus flagellatus]|uniref:alpha/beta hydrolase family protein n=1 Tax=Methylobacillus flagellatus TaxID=405 RepID=UPI0010F6D0C0|nr:alpha/beta hydrolase [Methylobacillus flagellatus]